MGGQEGATIKRGHLKATLTRFWNYLQSAGVDLAEVKIRREKIEEVWAEYEQVQAAIDIEEGDNVEAQIKYRTEFEDLYFKSVAAAEKIIIQGTPETALVQNENGRNYTFSNATLNHNNMAKPMVKLAALNVPIFSGNYQEWSSFKDIFSALVDSNISLSAIEKFFYLRTALSGEALSSIKCLETTADNYVIAWNSLITRYDNKKILVQAHVKAIYDLETIGGESAIRIRQFADALNGHMRALEALGQQPNQWGPLLTHLISMKLDKFTLKEWESSSSHNEVPLVSELVKFLENRFKILESIETAKGINIRYPSSLSIGIKKQPEKRGSSQSLVATSHLKCYFCGLGHTIYKCPSFVKLSISDRIKRVNELKLCKICLRQHEGIRCGARYCFKCAKPHNALLHLVGISANNLSTQGPEVQSSNIVSDTSDRSESSSSVNAHTSSIRDDRVLLSTAIVLLRCESGNFEEARVLLDSGSQSNLITEQMVQILKLQKKRVNHNLCGIGKDTQRISSAVITDIKAKDSNFTLTASCLVVSRITKNIPTSVIKGNILIPSGIRLADPCFQTPQKIDLLIGAKYFFDLLRAGQVKPVSNGPIFQETCFGWVVAGPVNKSENSDIKRSNSFVGVTTNEPSETELEDLIAKFWRLEEYEAKTSYTLEEKTCKINFSKNVCRDNNGRFMVHLPFNEKVPKLGNSYEIAKRRLLLLEKRFIRDPQLKKEYVNFMSEYEALGHMKIVDPNSAIRLEKEVNTYYIPHHAVRNENSTTTKLRVVFDASCKSDTGVSLNDVLMKGPVIQDDLIYILARFRTYNYVLSADIAKMYRQVLVTENHRQFQRILWRADPTRPIQIFQLNTLTYGTVPASFLATACLEKLAEIESNNYPDACVSIRSDFYMDDYLGGSMYKADAIRLRDNINTIMNSAGLELHKWLSNDPEIMAGMHSDNDNTRVMGDISTKILGLHWKSDDDILSYTVRQMEDNTNIISITKRKILSEIATIFDPLGLLGPVLLNAKLIMQILWRIKVGWDDPLPENICQKWQKYKNGLPLLNNLAIPRKIIANGNIDNFEVHGFADASIKAYGACLYLRSTGLSGTHIVRLICAKSKVAPLKVVSLPRLELCAALLLSRMAHRIIPKLRLKISRRQFWSDSRVALAWIAAPSTRWKTFVAHRVGEIQELTLLNEWSHVRTQDNPADLISRGCDARNFAEKLIWWQGPEWLSEDSSKWPKNDTNGDEKEIEIVPEEKFDVTSGLNNFVCTTTIDYPLLSTCSSLKKIVRITAYCLRWRNNGLKVRENNFGPLQVSEIDYANLVLIKMVQKNYFNKEIKELKAGNLQVSATSKLFRLRPFCDENDILRVGGRLKNAEELDLFQKHQIILPGDNEYTRLLFRSEHVEIMHGGPQALIASIRQKYWPLKARNIARNTVHNCVTCFKLKPVIVQPIMGDLPRDRVVCSRPFSRCGVDFAGPIMLRSSLRRKAPCNKGYICIFVCFATKAVHIEVVSDLTTRTFLHALNRFFDRRGRSSIIYSDNATNFVGARKILREVFQSTKHQDEISTALADKGVQWKSIPPRSPHFGGLWEAAVKSMKYLLYRVLGESRLTYEEMNTVITRVEACLNSRPLTPISSDPSDISVLTPGHFLIGDTLTSVPERDETVTAVSRLDRWRRVTQYSQTLWKRWSTEYLSQLQERVKWAGTKGPTIKVGTIVLIRDPNLPSLKWRLGRVTAVHVGNDSVTRSAVIQTTSGELKRAVRLLCPLPLEGNGSTN